MNPIDGAKRANSSAQAKEDSIIQQLKFSVLTMRKRLKQNLLRQINQRGRSTAPWLLALSFALQLTKVTADWDR